MLSNSRDFPVNSALAGVSQRDDANSSLRRADGELGPCDPRRACRAGRAGGGGEAGFAFWGGSRFGWAIADRGVFESRTGDGWGGAADNDRRRRRKGRQRRRWARD